MARNKLTDLNDHLFAQLERLNDEDISPEQVKLEVARAKAISGVASQIINSSKVTLDAMKLVASGKIGKEELPDQLIQKQLN